MKEEETLSFLASPKSYPHDVASVQHIETHISHIFLTGEFAYKVKKPLNLGFLDFSDLAKRREMIERELELNRRYAPSIYVKTLPIYRNKAGLTFAATGNPIEYVLVMKQFDTESVFSELLAKELLTKDQLYEVTAQIAHLHKTAKHTPQFWSFETVQKLSLDNIAALASLGLEVSELHGLIDRTLNEKKTLIERRRNAFVRSLHGDIHLGNICIFEGKATLFDGIEFNDEYSCIDTIADIAFLIMDLLVRNKPDLAAAVLNRYLELTDDFEGLSLLRLYVSYRALVRAKVTALAVSEGHVDKTDQVHNYLLFAKEYLLSSHPTLTAVGGTSGSGKSRLSRNISEILGGVVIRSDAVRKHLIGINPYMRAPQDAYTETITKQTYTGLHERGALVLDAGYNAILDAVFLSQRERNKAEQLARLKNVRFYGIWCSVDPEIAKQRISKRTNDISDATIKVLERQIQKPNVNILWNVIDTSGEQSETVKKALSIIKQ